MRFGVVGGSGLVEGGMVPRKRGLEVFCGRGCLTVFGSGAVISVLSQSTQGGPLTETPRHGAEPGIGQVWIGVELVADPHCGEWEGGEAGALCGEGLRLWECSDSIPLGADV